MGKHVKNPQVEQQRRDPTPRMDSHVIDILYKHTKITELVFSVCAVSIYSIIYRQIIIFSRKCRKNLPEITGPEK